MIAIKTRPEGPHNLLNFGQGHNDTVFATNWANKCASGTIAFNIAPVAEPNYVAHPYDQLCRVGSACCTFWWPSKDALPGRHSRLFRGWQFNLVDCFFLKESHYFLNKNLPLCNDYSCWDCWFMISKERGIDVHTGVLEVKDLVCIQNSFQFSLWQSLQVLSCFHIR
jgi:hypothetical protein